MGEENNKKLEKSDWIGLITMFSLIILLIGGLLAITITHEDAQALASPKANAFCQEKGYTFYDSYETTYFSSEPIGIRCRYDANVPSPTKIVS